MLAAVLHAVAILTPEQISELIGAKSGIRGVLVALAIGAARSST